MIDKNVKSLLKSKSVKKIPENKRILAISDIINNTKDDIDVELLSRKLASKMRNDGFILTATISGNALSTDEILKNTRNIRSNEEFNQKTVVNKGKLIAPNYSLSGKIIQRSKNIGKKERLDYYFLLTLTDITTGLIVWDNETIISKVIDKKEIEQYANNPYQSPPPKILEEKKSKGLFSNYFLIGLETRMLNLGSVKIPPISLKPYGYGNDVTSNVGPSWLSFDLKLGYMLALNKGIAFQLNALYSYSNSKTDDVNTSYFFSWKGPLKDISCYKIDKDCTATATGHKLGGEFLMLFNYTGTQTSTTDAYYISGGLLADVYSSLKFDIRGIDIERTFNSLYPFISLGWMYFYDKVVVNIGTKLEWSVDGKNYFSQGWSLLTLGFSLKL